MKISILTLFPEMFHGVFSQSILKQAQEKKVVDYQVINFREFSEDRHQRVDDYPYGGGGGMVLTPQPIFDAVDSVKNNMNDDCKKTRVILLCPQGEPYSQKKAEELSQEDHLILICGHYEGYDERIREHVITDEISIGDYVLTGGEIGAMVIADSVTRLLPGALGNAQSSITDSHSTGLLEYPHYTRPAEFRGLKVPDILLSGHHKRIDEWRHEQALKRTYDRRPDMLEKQELSKNDKDYLQKMKSNEENG
ncbi:tRNA (guanosine(37)-N1)-methyltransferase TrmD [Salipaludibacillus daqingensis]|uniref:tRNA (guanosine(37)-N1)-methyltransferase TrmD n=1 Tax=Salipaludibacillus daqingensis TaxID=3041001 RepID=UPI00247508BF|nr:tRNA (guanosine(37)-N1)-methyltransferase TrmD [Salipaludibacillus daqingensis]